MAAFVSGDPSALEEKVNMKFKVLALMFCPLSPVTAALATDRNWQTGTLTATERQTISF
jgi:hypothetical protein